MKNHIMSTVYIDEAGDLGIKTGTRWFVISAVIVDHEEEKNIRTKFTQIKSVLNLNEIHMCKIRDFNKRAYVLNTIKKEKFTYFNILVDTNMLDRRLSSLCIYNYCCRFLIERVSWFLRDTNRIGNVVLSSRGTSRDDELIEYIKKLISFTGNHIVGDLFYKITAKAASQWELLQLADICANSMFLSHNINSFGFIVPCFAKALKSHLYSYNGHILKYGIKYFNDNMQPNKNDLKSTWLCA